MNAFEQDFSFLRGYESFRTLSLDPCSLVSKSSRAIVIASFQRWIGHGMIAIFHATVVSSRHQDCAQVMASASSTRLSMGPHALKANMAGTTSLEVVSCSQHVRFDCVGLLPSSPTGVCQVAPIASLVLLAQGASGKG